MAAKIVKPLPSSAERSFCRVSAKGYALSSRLVSVIPASIASAVVAGAATASITPHAAARREIQA